MGLLFATISDESRVIKLRSRDRRHAGNKIDTAKYNLITFLPKSLLLQFTRLSNVVFLANAVLQAIPIISTITPITAISPLAFVLGISMLREGYEDYKRHKKDWEINSRKSVVLRNREFIEVDWDEIHVGDFVKIKDGEVIPADILLLFSSSETGICYVETSNLDGENNLKEKHVVTDVPLNLSDELESLKGELTVQQPSSNLFDFTGKIELQNRQPLFIGFNNLLLRETVLKNTEEIIGIALYCGHEAKILKNQGKIHHKMSNIEKQVNYIQFGLILLVALLCTTSSVGYSITHEAHNLRNTGSYIPNPGLTLPLQSLLMFFTIFLLLNFLIPVTLNILIQGIKTFSAIWLAFDRKLYDKTIKKYCGVLNSSIVEQLGIVDCVLTDKTGTLTANLMIFRAITIEDKVYLREYIQEHIQTLSKSQEFHDFMVGMIICHDVIRDTKKQEYQGSSPDEVCFINFASEIGYRFINKTKNQIEIEILSKKKRYELVDVLPFSIRKRMSVIVKDTQKRNRIIMFTKGADSAIFEKAHWYRQSEQFNFNIDAFAKQGLRTLVFAKKGLTSKELKTYFFEKDKIKTEIRERLISKQEAIEKEMRLVESLESSLDIIGATGIQDKLQEDVPRTLSRLQQAEIRVMMITGDKLQTAENIGYLSHLIKQNYKVYKISVDIENIQSYAMFIRNQSIDGTPFTLIIEGKNIAEMMNEQHKQTIKLYINLLTKAKSVIFCRSSPKEKATIVKFVKDKMKLTVLAIGDGGNDVGMIQQAHIGVGILGKQGNSAAAVSDFSFGKFKFLDRLILHHGRWFYYRLSYFFVFFGIKNMVITMVIFLYMIDSAFSGNLIYTELFYLLYNAFIGVAMMVSYGLFDQDINDDLQPQIWSYLPRLYKETKSSQLFSYKRYIIWSISGIILSCFIYYIIRFSLLSTTSSDSNGFPSDLEEMRIAHGLCLNFIIMILNYLDTQAHTPFFTYFVFMFCSVFPTTAYIIAENQMRIVGMFHAYSDNFNMRFWLTVFLVISIVYLLKIGYSCLQIEYFPSTIDLYKIAKSEDEERKGEIFKTLLKQMKKLKNEGDFYQEKISMEYDNKDWTSNLENNSYDLINDSKKYRSASVKLYATEQCLKQDIS